MLNIYASRSDDYEYNRSLNSSMFVACGLKNVIRQNFIHFTSIQIIKHSVSGLTGLKDLQDLKSK